MDVISFLAWRDRFGKTVSHLSCIGKESSAPCDYPRTLAAGTVDNNIGKLRSIFKEAGRGSFWDDNFQWGSPAAHSSVKKYHSVVLEEQTISRIFPKQAVPMIPDKLKLLCSHLREQVVPPKITASTRYIFERNLAFFSPDFFSGDRGSDDVLSLEDGKGYLVNQVFGKSLRGNCRNIFGVKPVPSFPSCPVKNVSFYGSLAKMIWIDLNSGYLFRICDCKDNILDAPFAGSTVENRLQKHLRELMLDDGETLHRFRSGCSITLSLLGVPYVEVAKLVGWRGVDMASYYYQYDKVTPDEDAGSILSRAAKPASSTSSSSAKDLGKEFREETI